MLIRNKVLKFLFYISHLRTIRKANLVDLLTSLFIGKIKKKEMSYHQEDTDVSLEVFLDDESFCVRSFVGGDVPYFELESDYSGDTPERVMKALIEKGDLSDEFLMRLFEGIDEKSLSRGVLCHVSDSRTLNGLNAQNNSILAANSNNQSNNPDFQSNLNYYLFGHSNNSIDCQRFSSHPKEKTLILRMRSEMTKKMMSSSSSEESEPQALPSSSLIDGVGASIILK
ncbi:hypothetical protein TRFO_09106 [Tritrichomonas foetus]|uniref:Uncharacterized protein n=1 Tax=Tritrichomonas foetus TaxID=1144522 RepID=A0A1J4JH03_9EUKA|nr:hypothetical protein TRFO_09106 [Tritrichomonas foetus]|eukprot:OHS97969.1 hypothetical protein TRFO_09106 [Tritrichomonas foetus]